jgi:hypothetical protein
MERERGMGNREQGEEATVSGTTGQSPGSQKDSLTETSTPDSAETAFLKLPTPETENPVPRSLIRGMIMGTTLFTNKIPILFFKFILKMTKSQIFS